MAHTGILLHVYHLEAHGWEELVWGDTATNKLGTVTKLVEILLSIDPAESVETIIYSGPSQKDGLTEGAYTRQFLLDRIERLNEFPVLHEKLRALTEGEHAILLERVQNIVIGPVIKNTEEEVVRASEFFANKHVAQVIQIASASHAPRCLQAQVNTRAKGLLACQWFAVASDTCFTDTAPDDVVILEPPHRGDDPMTEFSPTLAHVIKPYFGLSPNQKKQFIAHIASYTDTIAT